MTKEDLGAIQSSPLFVEKDKKIDSTSTPIPNIQSGLKTIIIVLCGASFSTSWINYYHSSPG